MTDALIIPFSKEQELVITVDNSGAIGEKKKDVVQTSNQVVGQFACRVALMEMYAAYGKPTAIIMQNFTSEEAWFDYKRGVQEVLKDAGVSDLPITGSTESNFPGIQSAFGLTMIGIREKRERTEWPGKEAFAVIGTPFVGEEVLNHQEVIPPVKLLKEFTEREEVVGVQPVGSKGIQRAYERWTGRGDKLVSTLDLEKTAGPATCFLIAYHEEQFEQVRRLGGELFHQLKIDQT